MKVFCTVFAFCATLIFAQEQSNLNVQKDSSKVSSTSVIQDDELILGDDEDIIKAQKQDTISRIGTSAESLVPNSDSLNKIEDIDEELQLDGGEESVFGVVKEETDANKDTTILSTEQETMSKSDTAKIDSTEKTSLSEVDQTIEQSTKDSVHVESIATEPPKIEKTGSINFARNLKEYRSPRLAMLLSLLVPGAGQVYAKHNSWKAAIYGAVEVGMIATSAAIYYKGKEKEKSARTFADKYYSYDKYLIYQNKLKSSNKVTDSVYNIIFLGGTDSTFEENAKSKNNAYYSAIRDNDQPFVNGWQSSVPEYDDNMLIEGNEYVFLPDPEREYLVYPLGGDTSKASYGFSTYQKDYNSQLSEATGYFRNSSLVLTLMLVNHIVSAVDAGITAKAHNDKMLQKESFWHRIELNQMYVSTSSGIIPGYALKVRF